MDTATSSLSNPQSQERLDTLEGKLRSRELLVAVVKELSMAKDLASVMDIVRTAARKLTGADGATFVLREGEYCYYAEEDAIAPLWKGKRFPLETCISGWVMLNRKPAIIADIYQDARIPQDAYRPTFVQSMVMVPIRSENPIGAIGNYWAEPRTPTDDEVELLQSLADTTAIILENLDVEQQLKNRYDQERLKVEIIEDIRSETDLDAILAKTVNRLGLLTEADRCVIWLYDASVDGFKPPEYEYRQHPDMPYIRDTAFFDKPVLSNLSRSKIRQIDNIEQVKEITEQDRQLIRERGIKGLLHVPISYKDHFLGIVRLHVSDKRKWSEETVSLVCHIAGQVAIAIYHAETLHQLADSETRKSAIMEAALDAIITIDRNGKILEWNRGAEKAFGYTADEVMGKPMCNFIMPERYKAAHQTGLDHYLATGEGPILGKRIELPALRKDGSEFVSEISIVPLRQGDKILFTSTLRDITEQKQAKEALKESEERFRIMADAAPNFVWTLGPDGERAYLNKYGLDFFGATEEEFLKNSWPPYLHPDDVEPARQALKQAIETRTSYRFEHRIKRADGEYRWVLSTADPSFLPNGELYGYVGSSYDITEPRQREMEIRQANKLLATISRIQSRFIAEDDYWVLFADLVQDVLDLTESEFGYIGEILYKETGEPYLVFRGLTNISWNDETRELYSQLQTVGLEFHNMDSLYGAGIREGGSLVIANDPANDPRRLGFPPGHPLVTAFMGLPIYGEGGKLLGQLAVANRQEGYSEELAEFLQPLLVTCSNIIEACRTTQYRKQAEAALKESEARFRALVNTMPQMAWTANPDGYLDWYNDRWYEFTGFSREAGGDQSWLPILHPDDAQNCLDTWYRSVHTGELYQIEYRFWDQKTEQWRWHLGRAYPLHNDQGQIIKWFGTCTDIQSQKSTEEALRESESRLRGIMEATPECIKIVGCDGTLLYMNKSGLDMIEADQEEGVVGCACVFDVIVPEYREQWIENHKRVCAGENLAWDFDVIGIKGTRRRMETHAVPLPGPDGSYTQLAVTRDVTQRKQTEESLRKSEERYSLVVYGSNDGIWDWDHKTDTIFWNERCYDQLEIPHGTRITSSFFISLIHPDDRDKSLAIIQDHLQQDKPYEVEFRLRRASGEYGYYFARGKTVRDEDGNPVRTAGVRTDITSLKEAEQALKESEQRYQMLYEWEKKTRQVLLEIRQPLEVENTFSKAVYVMANALNAHRAFIIEFDEAGQVCPVRYEYRSEESVKPFTGMCPPWDFCPYLAITSKKQLAAAADTWDDAAVESNPDWYHFSREYDIRGIITAPVVYQGKLINVLVLHTAEPREWDERELFFTKIVTDQLATSFYQAQLFEMEQLAKREASIRERQQEVVAELGFQALSGIDLQELMDIAVDVVARTFDVEYCKILELLPGGEEVFLKAGVGWQEGLVGQATVSTGLDSQAGYTLISKEPVIVEDLRSETRFSGPPLLYHHGVISGLSLVIYTEGKPWGVMGAHSTKYRKFSPHDVNFFQSVANVIAAAIERKQIEQEKEQARQEAQEANRKKSQFLANMSHELRTPLNAVIGYSSMMKQGIAGELTGKQEKFTRNIELSGKHLLDMVNDILDVSKIEAGKLELSFQSIDLKQLMKELEDIMSGIADHKKVDLDFYVHPGLDTATADPARLRQIFFNLISNAIKFNKDGGRVHVRLSQDGEWIVAEVEDTGIGIPKDKQGELFSEFFQVDDSMSRSHEGTGLGLALTKRLVELHGGEMTVKSEEGVGSVFAFRIPVKPPPAT